MLFAGDINTLTTNTGKLAFAGKLDAYYTATILETTPAYAETTSVDIATKPTEAVAYATNLFNYKVGGVVVPASNDTTSVSVTVTSLINSSACLSA